VKTALPKAEMCHVAGKMLPNTQQLLSVSTQVVDLGFDHLVDKKQKFQYFYMLDFF
jgi:hypothetical protein